jgi:hypothetical protein
MRPSLDVLKMQLEDANMNGIHERGNRSAPGLALQGCEWDMVLQQLGSQATPSAEPAATRPALLLVLHAAGAGWRGPAMAACIARASAGTRR